MKFATGIKVADEVQAAKLARDFTHTVIDTGQRPSRVDLKALVEGCNLLVIPAVPATLDTEGLVLTLQVLHQLGDGRFKVLLTKVPPPPEQDGPSCALSLPGKVCHSLLRTSRASRHSRRPWRWARP
jgi:chromosome partitioning protein